MSCFENVLYAKYLHIYNSVQVGANSSPNSTKVLSRRDRGDYTNPKVQDSAD